MRIDYENQGGLTIEPTGEFDYSIGMECVKAADSYIRDYGSIQITVDFRQTTYMDSSGIGALIVLLRKLPYGAPSVRLVHPSSTVLKIMEVCHLHKLFKIEPRPNEE